MKLMITMYYRRWVEKRWVRLILTGKIITGRGMGLIISIILVLGISLWDDADACAIESALSCPETADMGQPFACTLSIDTEAGTIPAVTYTAPIAYTWGDTGTGEITNAVFTGSDYNTTTNMRGHRYEVTIRLPLSRGVPQVNECPEVG